MKRRAVGLDIGSRYVRVVELAREGASARIARFAQEEIGGVSVEARAQAVMRAMQAAGISERTVVCAVSRADATVKRIRLPATDRETVGKMLAFEAQQHLPFPMEEVAWDFDLAADGSVLLLAGRAGLMDDLRAVLSQARLRASAIGISSAAAAAAYLHFCATAQDCQSPQAAVLLELGAGPVIVNVLSGGAWRFSRPLPVSGDELTGAFAADLGCDLGEARRVREMGGVSALPPDSPRVGEWMRTLRGEIQRSLLAAAEGTPALAADRVVADGSGWLTPGLAEAFSSVIGIPVAVSPDALAQTGPAFGVAVGLALQGLGLVRGVNLGAPAVEGARKKAGRSVYSVAVAAVLLLSLGLGTWRYWDQQQRSMALQSARAADARRAREVRVLRQRERTLKAQLAELERLMSNRYRLLEALNDLSAVAPKGIWLTSIAYSPGRPVAVQGRASSSSQVADLLDAMQGRAGLSYVKQLPDEVDFSINIEQGAGD